MSCPWQSTVSWGWAISPCLLQSAWLFYSPHPSEFLFQPPCYLVLDNTASPQVSDLKSNFSAPANAGICSSPDYTVQARDHQRIGVVLGTDSCWRWPFNLAAGLMQKSFPFLQAIFVTELSASITFLVCVENASPKVQAPLRRTLGPRCLLCPQLFSCTLAFLGYAYFKGPYSSIVSLCHLGGWWVALLSVLLPIWKVTGFMNFPLPNFETSRLTSFKKVYYFLKNYESYTIFLFIGILKPAYSLQQIKCIMYILQ